MRYGRRRTYAETNVYNEVYNSDFFNRTIRGQIRSVDHKNGVITVDYEGFPSGGKLVTVKPLWISFPPGSGPSWGRYMPQETDLVRLSFDVDNSPYVVGYDISATDKNVAIGVAGWPAINDEHEKVYGNDGADPSKAKFAHFVPLNPGEYDFMSSGGAYIHGTNTGELYMAGGTVSMSFVKNDLRISARSMLFTHTAQDCDFRIGQVRRQNAQTGLEEAVGDGKNKEFSVTVKKSVSMGVAIDVASMSIGHVTDTDGNEVKNSAPTSGQHPTRYSYTAYTEAGMKALEMKIDSVGNFEVMAPNADSGMFLDFTASDFHAKFTKVKWDASTEFTIDTQTTNINSNKVNINSNDVNIGNNASHPLILSNTYRQAETTYVTNIDALFQQVVIALNATSGAITSISSAFSAASSVVPPLGGVVTALTTAVGTISSSAGSIASSSITTKNAFVTQYDTYLSQVARTA